MMKMFSMKTGLALAAFGFLSACGTSETRILVSDMKEVSGQAEIVAAGAAERQAVYDQQLRAALGDLYVAYVRQSWLAGVNAACADAEASTLKDYQAAVTFGQQQGKTAMLALGNAVTSATTDADLQLKGLEQTLATLVGQVSTYPNDSLRKLQASEAQGAYFATAIKVAKMRSDALRTGGQGISDALDAYMASLDTLVTKELQSMATACEGARAQTQTAAVEPLDLGALPTDGNAMALMANYAKEMGTASDALENYFNTYFSSGKNSLLGILGKNLFSGLVHGSSTPVTGTQIKDQADSMISGASDWAKQAANGLKSNVSSGIKQAKSGLVANLAAKAKTALQSLENKVATSAAALSSTK